MIPQIEKIKKKSSESFYVGHYHHNWFERTWHYHPEYELVLITQGFGTRVVGNQRCDFEVGDLVLIGGNIPHAWFSDASFFDNSSKAICESFYIQFHRSIFGNVFSNLPEMNPIKVLLSRATLGLQLHVDMNDRLVNSIVQLRDQRGLERLLSLIGILEQFRKRNFEIILSEGEQSNLFIAQSKRLEHVHDFVMRNYNQHITVNEIADRVGMNVSSFCRYFKRMTQRTFSQYLKEIRIDFAQQLLINTDLNSTQICFECGFNSTAYFNQCFKNMSKMSPLEYRKKYKAL